MRQFRRTFSDPGLMLSKLALSTLAIREAGKGFHTIRSEQGHALQRHDFQSKTGPGKTYMHHARRNIVAQATASHVQRNGQDPARRLLQLPRSTFASVALAADPFAEYLSKAELQKLNDVRRPSITVNDIIRPDMRLQLAGAAAHDDVQLAVAGGEAAMPQEIAVKPGKGGNVFHTISRAKFRALKLLVGDRTLTKDEVSSVYDDAHAERASAQAEGGARWQRWLQLYQQEVRERKTSTEGPAPRPSRAKSAPARSSSQPQAYAPLFGLVGTPLLPLQPEVLMDTEPPSDKYVYKDRKYIFFPEDVVYPLCGQSSYIKRDNAPGIE
jgi:hypothetical protein